MAALYWDTSAVISALFPDDHSGDAARLAALDGIHILSSLAWIEAHAVISNLERSGHATATTCTAAREALSGALWHRTTISPSWTLAPVLARAHSLRGADLWHLAAAKDLQKDLPELALASFDDRLLVAAAAEGFSDPCKDRIAET